jgi:hypothetical protein
MMGVRENFQEEFYYNFPLGNKVSKDHLLRKIKEQAGFSFIYELVKDNYSHTGASSVDPVVVLSLP